MQRYKARSVKSEPPWVTVDVVALAIVLARVSTASGMQTICTPCWVEPAMCARTALGMLALGLLILMRWATSLTSFILVREWT